MIRLRMGTADLARMRFAYSPLTEVAESLYILHSRQIHPLHRGWLELAGESVRRADNELLRAVVPTRGVVANFMFDGAVDTATTIERQLQLLADCPSEQLRVDLKEAWNGAALPAAARQLIADGASGASRLAEALWRYWQLAIEPHWGQIRAVLDADIAYRVGRLARGGIEALFADLHPRLRLNDQHLEIGEPGGSSEHDLFGSGVVLVPCVFAWPHVLVEPSVTGQASATYGPRGVATLWQRASPSRPTATP